jgi:hypothetical protein
MVNGSNGNGVFATAVKDDDRMVTAASTAAAQSMTTTAIAAATISQRRHHRQCHRFIVVVLGGGINAIALTAINCPCRQQRPHWSLWLHPTSASVGNNHRQ